MSWLEKLLPPKIQKSDPSERRSIPEGLWIKCPSCESVLYKTDLEQNQNVCPTLQPPPPHWRPRTPQRFSGRRRPL
jgi:acetyl-CoA carboxylase beta subunit